MNADGRNVRRLTDDDGEDGEPSWSPDGKRITYVRDGRVYAMSADARDQHRLLNDGEWPASSPHATQIAYDVAFGDHDYRIAVGFPGGGWSAYGAVDDRRPVWSRDGRLLAFECRLGDHWHICVRNRDGRSLRYLTPHSSDAFAPAWSPDGKRLAFISDRDGPDQLFVMRADGTHVVRLTSGPAEKDTPAWAGR
jgi:Tol biopolymer transport system component